MPGLLQRRVSQSSDFRIVQYHSTVLAISSSNQVPHANLEWRWLVRTNRKLNLRLIQTTFGDANYIYKKSPLNSVNILKGQLRQNAWDSDECKRITQQIS